MKKVVTVVGCLLVAAAFCTCAGSGASQYGLESTVPIELSQEETLMGRLSAKEIQATAPALSDEPLFSYVDGILQRLLATLPPNRVMFKLTLLDTAVANAHATSDGHIFITRNMLVHLNSESELAATLSHEVAHVVLRHARQEIEHHKRAQQLAERIRGKGQTGQVQEVTQTFGKALVQGYNRKSEIEADRFALDCLRRAGYKPYAIVSMLQAMEFLESKERACLEQLGIRAQQYQNVFSSHPETSARIQAVKSVLEVRDSFVKVDEVERRRYLYAINNLVFGQRAESGTVRHGRYVNSTHNLVFDIPEGWVFLLLGRDLFLWPSDMSGMYLHVSYRKEEELQSDTGRPEEMPVEFDYSHVESKSIAGYKVKILNGIDGRDGTKVRLAALVIADDVYSFYLQNAQAAGKSAQDRVLDSLDNLDKAYPATRGDNRVAIVELQSKDELESLIKQNGVMDRDAFLKFNGVLDSGKTAAIKVLKSIK
ncbi:MAG: M48 family metalloprotease [Desulfobacterales bacterium]|nr:M48 family metalloprotease [Desulfobacterales bacterium]